MLVRQAVLVTPLKSSHPIQLPSRQLQASISPLAATLMNLPASVANKRLTPRLTSLAATLTKKPGGGAHPSSQEIFPFAFSYPLFLLFSYPSRLTYTTAIPQLFFNQSLTHSFHRDGVYPPFNIPTCNLPTSQHGPDQLSRTRQTTTSSPLYIFPVLSSHSCVRGTAHSSRLGGHHE